MIKRIADIKNAILLFLSFYCLVYLIVTQLKNLWFSLLLGVIWMFLFVVRLLILPHSERYGKIAMASFAGELLVLFFIGRELEQSALLFCISLAEFCISLPFWSSIAASLSSFFIFILSAGSSFRSAKDVVLLIIYQAPFFIFSTILSCLIGSLFQSIILAGKARSDTEEREVQLKIAYEQLEETAVLRERNRIAHQIHDTVGHTLTTAIMELEAGKLLWQTELEKAAYRYRLAEEQVKKSLEEIRRSVHMLADQEFSIEDELVGIMEDTMKHTGIHIKYYINLPQRIPERDKIILSSAVREGLHNGIRHGKATAFIVRLTVEKNLLVFCLSDNGIGCDLQGKELGFGLSEMSKGVHQANGMITFTSEPDEGFELEIRLPYEQIELGDDAKWKQ